MSLASWAGYLLLVLLAGAVVTWTYLRREPAGPGRPLLAGLRTLVLALVLLLLFDPARPGFDRESSAHREIVLLDASASMSLPAAADPKTTRWDEAVRAARKQGGTPILFGDRARPAMPDSLANMVPTDAHSLLLPALRAAAEAGAERVVVVTDGGIEDAGALTGWLGRLGLGVRWVRVGQPTPGLSLQEVTAPAWTEAGRPLELDVTLAALAGPPDSVRILVRQDGRIVGQADVASPAAGRSTRMHIPVRPSAPENGGWVRLEVALEPGDVITADDRRVVTTFVSADPAGVVLVSLRPEQEPRFLLPVLERALGLPVRGFQRVTPEAWLRVGDAQQAGRPATETDVRAAIRRADLLVLAGFSNAATPPWVLELLRTGRRLVVFAGSGNDLPLPPSLGEPVADDWFVAPEVPASPVAMQLSGVAMADAPPLGSVRPVQAPPGSWIALRATRGRSGQALPLLIAGEGEGRRWAVATAEGYWRWAFRGGDARQLYERFWGGVAGWLLRDDASVSGTPVRPVRAVVQRGERSRWVAAGSRPDSLRLRLTQSARVALDTVLPASAGDTVLAPLLPPGEYRYTASAYAGASVLRGEGVLVVETYAAELVRPSVETKDRAAAERVERAGAGGEARRLLHTAVWPYVLILVLLAAEWVLRRRWGLR